MDAPILYEPGKHAYLIPSIVALHAACITEPPYTIATFVAPLTHKIPAMTTWWETRLASVPTERQMIMQMARNDKGEEELAGYVMLAKPISETGPFRGVVEKLLVSPEWRERGVARRVMGKLEEVAKVEGRTLLMLDTVTGSPAELVYPRLGYIEVGIVPEYGIHADGSLKGSTIFYKNLLKEPTST